LTELIRLAAEEEGDRASPISMFGGGTFAWKQAMATLTDGKAMSREEKDAETIALLRAASADRAETKKRRSEDATRLRDAVLKGHHLDPYHPAAMVRVPI
jgi:alpha-beta hydrolase superfamily lysophospholipase